MIVLTNTRNRADNTKMPLDACAKRDLEQVWQYQKVSIDDGAKGYQK